MIQANQVVVISFLKNSLLNGFDTAPPVYYQIFAFWVWGVCIFITRNLFREFEAQFVTESGRSIKKGDSVAFPKGNLFYLLFYFICLFNLREDFGK